MLPILQNTITKIFLPQGILDQITTEEKRKRVCVVAVTLIAIPFLLGFGIVHLSIGEGIENSMADLLTAALFIATLLFLRTDVDGRIAYRTAMAGFTFLLFYNVAIGLYQGSDILWLYIYPLVAFFMFGGKEGFLWNGMLLGPVFLVILYPDPLKSYAFSAEYKVRLILSLSVITVVAWLLESLRAYFYEQMQEQKVELEKAADDIRVLKGLIPICSVCHKIRDDQGYWQALEEYITAHTGARMSHGICETCLEEAYPDIYQSMVAKGKIKK